MFLYFTDLFRARGSLINDSYEEKVEEQQLIWNDEVGTGTDYVGFLGLCGSISSIYIVYWTVWDRKDR